MLVDVKHIISSGPKLSVWWLDLHLVSWCWPIGRRSWGLWSWDTYIWWIYIYIYIYWGFSLSKRKQTVQIPVISHELVLIQSIFDSLACIYRYIYIWAGTPTPPPARWFPLPLWQGRGVFSAAKEVMHLIRKIYSSVQGVCPQCPRYCVSSTGGYT